MLLYTLSRHTIFEHYSQLCAHGTEGNKFIAFKHIHTADEMGLHFQTIRDWNTFSPATASIADFSNFKC